MLKSVDVEAINLGRRLALLTSGEVVSISSFFDGDGDETLDPSATLAFTLRLPSGMWYSGAVSDFQNPPTRH